MIELRDYRDEDYEELRKTLEETELFNLAADTREALREKIKLFPGSIILATVDDSVVGNVYFTFDAFISSIYRLAVRKDYRRRGIGRRLLTEAENRIRKLGGNVVDLRVRIGESSKLVPFYQKSGYSVADELHQSMLKILKSE